jgi:amino acid adenylation domain-containing protein
MTIATATGRAPQEKRLAARARAPDSCCEPQNTMCRNLFEEGVDMSPSLVRNDESAWQNLTMLDLFAERVSELPGATAVSSGGRNVSYAELDKASDRIASWLVEHQAGPEDVVAVEMRRGLDSIAALIGILKANAAYLALELDMPRPRRDRLVADAKARAVITSDDQAIRTGLPTLRLPEDLEAVTRGGIPRARQARPENLAYVCYTSGSTGQPKGVGVPHRAVVRLVSGDYVEFGPGQSFLCLSPVSFDASTFEIWGPLLTGGRVVVHPSGTLAAEELAAALHQEKVTTLFLTTALFHRMVDHNLDAFGGLRQLLTGGEVLDPRRFNRVAERFPELRLIAAYGPTENTTFSTCHPVETPIRTSWVPLGNPITGTAIHILDSDLKPAAPGSAGELCVSGPGLSRGYIGQPAATALSFVPNPFGSAGSRMYRTGDIVRQQSAGGLEFIGRGDRQVKVRGFRVEPAEVEREISAIHGVKESVVISCGDPLGEKRLIAYLVPDSGDDDPQGLAARVRRKLRSVLPAAMIPAAFVTMNFLPLTPNGKIDRASLPVPERAERQADADFVAPRSPTEQLLCDMWAESLQLEAVGVQDDFFELAGNSLLAMDLISRIETVFEVALPIRTLLYHPTVEEFAGAIDKLIAAGYPPV